jgi:uncharacterized protein with ParB-like and HNH nuclease domain
MKHLDITRTLYTVGDFVAWQKNKTLQLSPSFQRRPVWRPGAKSYLIDTILRGLPVPILFLRDKKTDIKTLVTEREVVDGQQRIRTVLSYVSQSLLPDFDQGMDDFVLKKVHNSELANLRFSELSPELQQRILDYQFSVHVLPSSLDDRDVLQIFARMNATGVKLNDQELRNANNFGEFKTLSFSLGAEYLEQWRDWGLFTEYNIARMEEVELTSEFLLMMLKGVTGKSQKAIDTVYDDYDDTLPNRAELERRFRHTMDFIDENFGEELPISPLSKKTLFYSLFASVYYLSYGTQKQITAKVKPTLISKAAVSKIRTAVENLKNQAAPDDAIAATSVRVTHAISRKLLIKYLSGIKL